MCVCVCVYVCVCVFVHSRDEQDAVLLSLVTYVTPNVTTAAVQW